MKKFLLLFKCPRELTPGGEAKPDSSCEWYTKFSVIPSERVHSKRIPKFSKTSPGIVTVPFNSDRNSQNFWLNGKRSSARAGRPFDPSPTLVLPHEVLAVSPVRQLWREQPRSSAAFNWLRLMPT